MTLPDRMFLANATRIVEFAAGSRIPALFPDQEFAAAGGLIAYGPSLAANFRLAAAFVVMILQAAKPADLPIEQPTTFSLVINVKTAKAMDFTIPQPLLGRADQVVE
jgi:putative ABC transport system substrate-binding protein